VKVMRARWALYAVAVFCGAALSGCAPLGGAGVASRSTPALGGAGVASRSTRALGGASVGSRSTRAAGAVVRADRTHEVPTPARRERASPGWTTPERAVRAFAAAYVNWTAATVSGRLRALARRSIGQARATLQLQAREVAADRELRRGRIANAGTVEAVGALAGSPRRYAVVTRERTSAANDTAYRGLAPEWHVSVATVTRVGRLWVLSGWQPES
jgi:hypothetical protein